MVSAIDSLSVRSSDMFFVPRTFLRVVAANNFVDLKASSTLHTDMLASKILV